MNSTIELLKSHRSIRKFTAEPVPQDMLETLVEAGQAAATSSFIQACTLIQVNDTDNRRLLAEYAGNQAYVAQAPVFWCAAPICAVCNWPAISMKHRCNPASPNSLLLPPLM